MDFVHSFWLWLIAMVMMFALAGIAPKIAVTFMGLLVVGVLVMNGDEYASLLSNVTGTKPLSN